jgi:cation transport regulator ChaC
MAKEVDVLGRACGAFGSSLDYLERTRVALVAHGIVDPYLETVAAQVAAAVPTNGDATEAGLPLRSPRAGRRRR